MIEKSKSLGDSDRDCQALNEQLTALQAELDAVLASRLDEASSGTDKGPALATAAGFVTVSVEEFVKVESQLAVCKQHKEGLEHERAELKGKLRTMYASNKNLRAAVEARGSVAFKKQLTDVINKFQSAAIAVSRL